MEGERQEVPIFYGPAGADAKPLVAPIDLAAAGERIDALLQELESDHPELKVDKLRLSGEITGRALALAQQPAEDEVYLVRPNYDDALVRAQQMAISIGGFRGYEGYRGFDLDSYGRGDLNHNIGHRRVFAKTPLDEYEEKTAFYTTFKTAAEAGAPLPRKQVWREAGYENIEALDQELQAQMEQAVNAALGDAVTGITP